MRCAVGGGRPCSFVDTALHRHRTSQTPHFTDTALHRHCADGRANVEFSPLDTDQTSEQDFQAITELLAAVDAIDRREWPPLSYKAAVGLLRSAVQTGPEPGA